MDHCLVYCHELEQLCDVPNGAFHTSLSLRVEEPAQVHESINRAAEHEFDGGWPAA